MNDARLDLRLPREQKERVERAAAGKGLSVNSWVRGAIECRLSHHKAERLVASVINGPPAGAVVQIGLGAHSDIPVSPEEDEALS